MAKDASASKSSRSADYTIFIDTNLNTHLAMIVSGEDTVGDLKSKIMIEHSNCFPNIGRITIHALKVKRRAQFYHLSDAMLVISAFTGVNRAWFLHADATSGQVRPTNDLLCMDPGSSKPQCFHSTNDPASETEKSNLHIDYPLLRVSNLEDSALPQVGGSDLVKHLVSLDDQHGAGNKVRESQTGVINLGVEHVTEENNKSSSLDANNEHSESEALKRDTVASKKNSVLKTNTECKKYKLKKRLREMPCAGMLVEGLNSGPNLKKKCVPEKKVEASVKNALNHNDFGTCITSEETSKPKEKLDSSSHSLVNDKKKESSKLQEELDCGGLSLGEDVVQDGSSEGFGIDQNGLDTNSGTGTAIKENVCSKDPTDHVAILNKEKSYSPVQELREGNLVHCSSLGGPHVAPELAFGILEGKTGVSKVKSGMDASELTLTSGGTKLEGSNKRQAVSAKSITPSLMEDPESLIGDVTTSAYGKSGIGDDNKHFDLSDKTKKDDGVLPQEKDHNILCSSETNFNHKSSFCNGTEINTKSYSNFLDTSGNTEAGDPGDKRKKRLKKTKSADAKNLSRENSPGNVITLRLEQEKASDCDNLGGEMKLSKLVHVGPVDDVTEEAAKKRESVQQIGNPKLMSLEATKAGCKLSGQDEAEKDVEGVSELFNSYACHLTEVGLPRGKRKKTSKKTKIYDAMGHTLTSGLGNANSAGDSILLAPEPDKLVDSDNPREKTIRKDTILFQGGKTKVSKILDASTGDDNIHNVTGEKENDEKVLLQSDHRVTSSVATNLKGKFLGANEADMTTKDGIDSSPLYASGTKEPGGSNSNHKVKKKLKKSKTSGVKSAISLSVAEHADAPGDAIPQRLVPDKTFDSAHPADKTDGEDCISSQNKRTERSAVLGGGCGDDNIGSKLIDETENKEKSLFHNEGTRLISFEASTTNHKPFSMNESGLNTNTKDGIGSSRPLDAPDTFTQGGPGHKLKRRSKKNKVSDTKSHVLSSDVEHTGAIVPLRSKSVNSLVDGHSADEANSENIIMSPTEKTKTLKIGESAQIDRTEVGKTLSLKEHPRLTSSEAVNSSTIEAQDLSDNRQKKSNKTRASKAKSHVSTSAVEHADTAEEVLPLLSESEKACDGNPCDETKKQAHISQNGETEAPIMKSVNGPLLGSDKQNDQGCVNGADDLQLTQNAKVQETGAFVDDKVKRKSIKGRPPTSASEPLGKQEDADAGDPTLSTDENKKGENASPKDLKKPRSRKKVLVSKSTHIIPESSQWHKSPDSNGSSQMTSDALENNKRRPLIAGHPYGANNHMDSDKVNFIDYFAPKQDHHEVASSAKEPEDKDVHIRRKNNKELKAGKKNRTLNEHSRGALHDIENSLDAACSQEQKNKLLVGSSDMNQLQGSSTKNKQSELQPKENGNAGDRLKGQTFDDHDKLESLLLKDLRKNVDTSGTISSMHPPQHCSPSRAIANLSLKEHNANWETSSSSTKKSGDRDYKKKEHEEVLSQPNDFRAVVRKTHGKEMGKVVNSSNKKESLLTTPKTIFKESGDDSSEVYGKVDSDSSTRTPDNSSSEYSEGENATDLDSPRTGYSGQKRKENDGKHTSQSKSVGSKNMTLDMILRGSSNYKKAKLMASQSQLDDTESQPIDFVPNSQA